MSEEGESKKKLSEVLIVS